VEFWIDKNAVKDIGLPSSEWLGHRPRKLGDVGSNPTGSDIFSRVLFYLQIYKIYKMCELRHSKIIVRVPV